MKNQEVHIPINSTSNLIGDLQVPDLAKGIVVFAHGSGSSRHSPRNRLVASRLNTGGLATLLIDLLTQEEERVDEQTAQLRFDIPLLTARLVQVTQWLLKEHSHLKIGYFGASTGAASALCAAAKLGEEKIHAVVSRGGRPDLAGSALKQVQTPTLLIVGGNDFQVIEMNEEALAQMHCVKKMVIVPHATHLFEEPGTLEQVAELALQWFLKHLL